MKTEIHLKQLLKILIGAAWIDGRVQPEEREYLYRVAQENNLADDPEIKPLLYELKPVSPQECYGYLEEYFGKSPTSEDYQRLMNAISGLVYSDGEIATEEAQLLNRLQMLDPATTSRKSLFDGILNSIRKLYQRGLDQQA
ncbi:MAG: TerB family tellurite resistance protein [Chroococcales cyanobacterium]